MLLRGEGKYEEAKRGEEELLDEECGEGRKKEYLEGN